MSTKNTKNIPNDSKIPQGFPERLPTVYEIWVLLTQLTEGMLKASDKELRPYGISSIQFTVLWVVSTADEPPTASELARSVQRRPSSIYALLDRMEKQGLLKIVRTTRGKPEVRAVVTKKGEETYLRARAIQKTVPRIMKALSEEELKQFEASLRTLRAKTYSELADEPSFP